MQNINLLFGFFLIVVPIVSFAKVDVENLPWYFESNHVKDCWEQYKKGLGVVVEIWDSKVQFGSLLRSKKYGYESYVAGCDKKGFVHKAWIHGTSMASLIAADVGREKCSYRTIYACEGANVAGLAPDSIIFNREIINSCSK